MWREGKYRRITTGPKISEYEHSIAIAFAACNLINNFVWFVFHVENLICCTFCFLFKVVLQHCLLHYFSCRLHHLTCICICTGIASHSMWHALRIGRCSYTPLINPLSVRVDNATVSKIQISDQVYNLTESVPARILSRTQRRRRKK